MRRCNESDKEQLCVKHCRVAMKLLNCKMDEEASADLHVQKMVCLIEQLGKLDSEMDLHLNTDLILQSLPKVLMSSLRSVMWQELLSC